MFIDVGPLEKNTIRVRYYFPGQLVQMSFPLINKDSALVTASTDNVLTLSRILNMNY